MSKQLVQLMTDAKVEDYKALASNVGVDPSTAWRWLNKGRKPDRDATEKLLKFFSGKLRRKVRFEEVA
jgi:hypothetical protein